MFPQRHWEATCPNALPWASVPKELASILANDEIKALRWQESRSENATGILDPQISRHALRGNLADTARAQSAAAAMTPYSRWSPFAADGISEVNKLADRSARRPRTRKRGPGGMSGTDGLCDGEVGASSVGLLSADREFTAGIPPKGGTTKAPAGSTALARDQAGPVANTGSMRGRPAA